MTSRSDIFEKGIKLSEKLTEMLDTAEKKVSILMTNDDGEIVKEDFTGADNE